MKTTLLHSLIAAAVLGSGVCATQGQTTTPGMGTRPPPPAPRPAPGSTRPPVNNSDFNNAPSNSDAQNQRRVAPGARVPDTNPAAGTDTALTPAQQQLQQRALNLQQQQQQLVLQEQNLLIQLGPIANNAILTNDQQRVQRQIQTLQQQQQLLILQQQKVDREIQMQMQRPQQPQTQQQQQQ